MRDSVKRKYDNLQVASLYGSVYDLYVNEKQDKPLSAHTVRALLQGVVPVSLKRDLWERVDAHLREDHTLDCPNGECYDLLWDVRDDMRRDFPEDGN